MARRWVKHVIVSELQWKKFCLSAHLYPENDCVTNSSVFELGGRQKNITFLYTKHLMLKGYLNRETTLRNNGGFNRAQHHRHPVLVHSLAEKEPTQCVLDETI